MISFTRISFSWHAFFVLFIYFFLKNSRKKENLFFFFTKFLILEILVTCHSQIFYYFKKYLSIWHLQTLCSKRFIVLCLISNIFNPVEDGKWGKKNPTSLSFITSENVGISPQKLVLTLFSHQYKISRPYRLSLLNY